MNLTDRTWSFWNEFHSAHHTYELRQFNLLLWVRAIRLSSVSKDMGASRIRFVAMGSYHMLFHSTSPLFVSFNRKEQEGDGIHLSSPRLFFIEGSTSATGLDPIISCGLRPGVWVAIKVVPFSVRKTAPQTHRK